MLRIPGLGGVAALAVVACSPPVSDDAILAAEGNASPPEPASVLWPAPGPFKGDRDFRAEARPWLTELGDLPAECLTQTWRARYPTFSGCIDWHSAVHAAWSLHVVTRLTGDSYYREVADSVLTAESLDETLDDVANGHLAFELPYGYSWALALAIERNRAGFSEVDPLADFLADELETYILEMRPSDIYDGIVNDDYDNLSWAVLHLWRYGHHTQDVARVSRIEDFVRDKMLPKDWVCPLHDDLTGGTDFFPPCLHLAMTLLTILPEEAQTYADGLSSNHPIEPLTTFETGHQKGLNFSRSWGLHALWKATGQEYYRLAAQEHLRAHYHMPEHWGGKWTGAAHWVPQFGIYGIALWFDEPED